MNEEEKKILKIFNEEVIKEQEEYPSVNDYTQFIYDNHKAIYELVTKLHNELLIKNLALKDMKQMYLDIYHRNLKLEEQVNEQKETIKKLLSSIPG